MGLVMMGGVEDNVVRPARRGSKTVDI